MGGRVDGHRVVESVSGDDGHYSDIRGNPAGGAARSSVYQHYIDIDRVTANSDGGQPASGHQTARSRGYEGLDASVLATLHQPQRPQDYVRLGPGEASTERATEEIEMSTVDCGNTVSLQT